MERGGLDCAVLVAHDRDLAETVSALRDSGARVVVPSAHRGSIATELSQLADDLIEPGELVQRMVEVIERATPDVEDLRAPLRGPPVP